MPAEYSDNGRQINKPLKKKGGKMLKRTIVILALALTLVSLLAVPALAAPAGKSNVGHVVLCEKDPGDWSIVADGASGQFNYKLIGEGEDTRVSGVFNGHGLEAGVDYSLIYYPEPVDNPWTEFPAVEVIGNATANEEGDVHIKGAATLGESDKQPLGGDYDYQMGDKIWLVLSADLTDGAMTAWNPTEYLFETELINTALLLVQKNSSDWSVVDDGAWGAYNYELSRGGKATQVSGAFKGEGLTPETAYTLIYYPEVAPNPWEAGGYEVVVIGNGVTDASGKLTIDGTAVIGQPDEQPSDTGDYIGQTGDKIWLVLSSDITDGAMTAWNPDAYLFETSLINTGK